MTEEGQEFWIEISGRTDGMSKFTVDNLLELREHFIAEVRLQHVGIISLMKMFQWDFQKETYKLNQSYCKEVFGMDLKLSARTKK